MTSWFSLLLEGARATVTKTVYVGTAARCFKANNQARLVERKVFLTSDSGNWAVRVADIDPEPDPPPLETSGVKALIDRSDRGAICRNSTVSSDSHLHIVHQWSDPCHLDCFMHISLQSQDPFVCISWGQYSELWQFMSWIYSGHYVVNFSTRCFTAYKATHRIWFRILPIDLEKGLKVIDYA